MVTVQDALVHESRAAARIEFARFPVPLAASWRASSVLWHRLCSNRTASMRWKLHVGLALAVVLFAANHSAAGVLDASWTAPTSNTDGSSLTDLGSYRVYYSTSATPCPGTTFFSVSSSTTTPSANQTVNFRLTGLTTGSTYNVAITALDTAGNESSCSPVASGAAQVDITVAPTTTVNFGTVNVG